MSKYNAKYNLSHHKLAGKWERIYVEEGKEGLYKERRGRGRGQIGESSARPMPKEIEEDLLSEVQH